MFSPDGARPNGANLDPGLRQNDEVGQHGNPVLPLILGPSKAACWPDACLASEWIPAKAEMTDGEGRNSQPLILSLSKDACWPAASLAYEWIPGFAGMTEEAAPFVSNTAYPEPVEGRVLTFC